MNYARIYMSIVLRAQCERAERMLLKKMGNYFERHHIVPRALGGTDSWSNKALLTGREHFICHWLLVKIYRQGTEAHNKMMYALWRMQSVGKDHAGRYVNAHVYEYYRTEMKNVISQMTSKCQAGKSNSQYGTIWYTNAYNGMECKSKNPLEYPWVKGRKLFTGENTPIYTKQQLRNMQVAKELWDLFHSGNFASFSEFARTINKPLKRTGILALFKKYVPISRQLWISTTKPKVPQRQYIGVYY